MEFLKQVVTMILIAEARLVLARYKPRIIAVTGSVGKTTTKDAIFVAIAGQHFVRKSEKSYNGAIGVPLTILGTENAWRNPVLWLWNMVRGAWLIVAWKKYPEWLVIEVGADRPGDISSIARWLRPEIVVLTGVSEIPVHIEYFDSPQALLKEKRSLAEHLRPEGTLIVNGDDPLMQQVRSESVAKVVTYGLEGWNNFAASNIELDIEGGRPTGVQFDALHGGATTSVVVAGAIGYPRVYAALAALAVAQILGDDVAQAAAALATWQPPAGRLRLIPGIKGSLIIDDTYNSSPAASFAALDALAGASAKRRIAVLADMLELGKYSAEAHRAIGVRAAAVADILITVGFRSRVIAEAALDAGMKESDILQYDLGESRRAAKELEARIEEGDVVLIKGSQSMRMERAVEELMAEPTRAEELLVRQDEEWKKRL